jgi:dienelactone hydrolase
VDDSAHRRPFLIIHSGFDGSAEELHSEGARAAVERGYNVLTFDGPGQYGPLHRQGLTFRPDWEKVVARVVDFALTLAGVDAEKIALMGISMGGVLALRAAAFEKRISVLIANDGLYDFGAAILASIPPELQVAAEAGLIGNAQYHLRDGIAESISCPTLVLDAEGDMFFKGQPEALYDHLTCPKTMIVFTESEGAGSHCQVEAHRLAFARIYDWLDEILV